MHTTGPLSLVLHGLYDRLRALRVKVLNMDVEMYISSMEYNIASTASRLTSYSQRYSSKPRSNNIFFFLPTTL